jgi:hypothetical protein
MVCKKQFDYGFSYIYKSAVIRNYADAFPYVIGAGCQKLSFAVAFHDTDTADGASAQIGVVAEGGDENIGFTRRVKDLCALRRCNRLSVNG